MILKPDEESPRKECRQILLTKIDVLIQNEVLASQIH